MQNATVFTCEIFAVISLALVMMAWPRVPHSRRSCPARGAPRTPAAPRCARHGGAGAPWVTPCGGEARQRASAWSLLSYPKTSLTLRSPERCWSVHWGFLFSLAMPRFAFIGSITAALLLPRTYTHLCIYIGGECVYLHTEYTGNYHSSDGISKASLLTLHASGTSGGSPVSPSTVTRHAPQPAQGQMPA